MKTRKYTYAKALMVLLVSALGACSDQGIIDSDSNKVSDPESTGGRAIAPLASPVGDVVGKLVVGYQGWFACANDGSAYNTWVHWGGGAQGPRPGNQTFELWPDVREYTTTYQTGYANLGNGQPAKLFSSWDPQVVNKHFEWMQQHGIDCAAMQRFGKSDGQKDGIATRVRNAAQTYGRKFFIMYDLSGWANFQSEIKTDWTNVITGNLNLTGSSAYAIQNGKPVVCIWGMGVADRPGNVNSYLDVINWFKSQGCFVIIGVPRDWRNQTANLPAFDAANMITPWAVGTFNSLAGADSYVPVMQGDLSYCNARNIDYMPVIWPGFSWANWNGGAQNQIPRLHGDFMWRQFYNVKNAGMTTSYVAMFDEYDEGTAIAKAAENASMRPTNQWFLSLDADGVAVSSDFYLRLTRDGAQMLKGQIGLTPNHPTSHTTSSGAGVILYQDVNYGGAVSQALPIGNYTQAQLATRGVPNDWASSVRVPAGRTVILYAGDNFTGTSWTRTADTPNFTTLSPNANDMVSSVRVQ